MAGDGQDVAPVSICVACDSRVKRVCVLWLLALLALHVLPFLHRGALIGGDEPHYALMAYSIGVEGDFDLASDYDRVEGGSAAAGRKRSGQSLARHLRSIDDFEVFSHPVGLPLIAAPFLAAQMKVAPGSAPDVLLIALTLTITFTAIVVAWRMLAEVLNDTRGAALAVVCVYFGSPLWYYSRTFFTEPWIWALVILAVAAVRHRAFLLGGLCLGLALAVKEMSILIVTPILVVSAYRLGVRAVAALCLGPALWLAFFVWKNLVLVGTPLSTFQAYEVGDPLVGAIGLVFDPAHGLAWFAPLLVFGFAGLFRTGPIPRDIRLAALAAFGAYFTVTAAWVDWRGGSCYATRLLLPTLPILALGVANQIQGSVRTKKLIAALFVLGFLPNWCAVNNPFAAFWGTPAYSLIRENPAWAVVGIVAGPAMFTFVKGRFPGKS